MQRAHAALRVAAVLSLMLAMVAAFGVSRVGAQLDIGTITINKTDEAGDPLAGAAFELTDVDGIAFDSGVTAADGSLTLTGDIGPAILVETAAPTGFIAGADLPVVIAVGDTPITVINTAAVVPDLSSVVVTKTDEDGNLLAGATFDLLADDGSVIATATTNAAGIATFADLDVDALGDTTLTLTETDAPVGFVAGEDVTVTLTVGGVTAVTVVNTAVVAPVLSTLVVTKVDADGNLLAGAEFDLVADDGTVVGTATTDALGVATFADLDLDLLTGGDTTLVLDETVAPDGFVLGDDVDVTLTVGGVTTTTVVNVAEVGVGLSSVVVTKVDEDGNLLADATFDLVADDGEVIATATTNALGVAVFAELDTELLGDTTLLLVETEAPAGFVAGDDVEVTLTVGGVTAVTVVNTAAVEATVPATEVPATQVPATEVPATEVPATEVPATEVPDNGTDDGTDDGVDDGADDGAGDGTDVEDDGDADADAAADPATKAAATGATQLPNTGAGATADGGLSWVLVALVGLVGAGAAAFGLRRRLVA